MRFVITHQCKPSTINIGEFMIKVILAVSAALALTTSYAHASGRNNANGNIGHGGSSPYYNSQQGDNSNFRGGNSSYYNSSQNDNSHFRGGNNATYDPQDNRKIEVYGDKNSYRKSNGMIYNR